MLVLGWWGLDLGGFAVASWAPGGLILLGLLAVTFLTVPTSWRALPRTVLIAAACLTLFTVWSFASVMWADDPGFAWEGAGRTLVYLVIFCLFSLWPQHDRTAGWVLGALIATIALAAAVTFGRVWSDPGSVALLGSGRLKAPTGYPNATACLLALGLFPAIVLAASPVLRPWLRGVLTSVAVVLAGMALLTVSRGATYATPIVVAVLLAVVPGRLRVTLIVAVVGLAIAATASALLGVGDVVNASGDVASATHRALTRLLGAAALAGALTALVAVLIHRAQLSPSASQQLERTLAAAVIVVLVVAALGGLVVAGNPADRVQAAWSSFKGGYADNAKNSNRLVAGLGSNRYDFYRVGLRSFREHPVEGIGVDGFYQQYLRSGRSDETPRYPHSLEVRTLAQTGLVGAVLLLGSFTAVAIAALRAMRAGGPLRTAIAGGAAIGALYWVVHGSLDWFWEWTGLGAPVFALAGLACSLVPRRTQKASDGAPSVTGRIGIVVLAIAAAVPLLSVALADRERTRASEVFATRPGEAYARLDLAAAVDPFSSTPDTLAGSIAVRLGDLPRADAAFARALKRVPHDQYAVLERGAVASARGDRARALRLLAQAAALAPRDALTRQALEVVRGGATIDVAELNRRILRSATRLVA